jgi:DNA polymerase III delta prime subunit
MPRPNISPYPYSIPLLVNRYRPTTIKSFFGETCSQGQQRVLRVLMDIDDLNILFIGNTCSGKTTLLNILVREYYNLDIHDAIPENNILYINNLKEQGIGFFRGEMKSFCQASSTIFGKKKMVIIDDVDMIGEQSQQVFRNYIDKYKHNIHFVSVCTNIQKVIESFQSRMHIIRIEPPNIEQLNILYNSIVQNEGLTIDVDSKAFLFKYCTSTIRCFLNQLEKMYMLKRPITLDICMKLCTDISFHRFEEFIQLLREDNIARAINHLYKIYDYGYSVIDIYDYMFNFVKNTSTLCEIEKYRIIPVLCNYISIFHNIHEDPIELALFTNKIKTILDTPHDDGLPKGGEIVIV